MRRNPRGADWLAGWADAVRPVPVRRFYLLDGARGLAALAVLLFHYHHFFVPPGVKPEPALHSGNEPLRALFGPLYDHGHLSVSFFWVLSGFVFAATYNRETASTRDFFVNRLARLYPLHLLTLCIIAGVQAVASERYGHWFLVGNNDLTHFVAQLFFASDWGLVSRGSFNGPIWSVSVEVLIYGVFWSARRHLFRFGLLGPLIALATFMLLINVSVLPGISHCGFFFFLGVATYVIFARTRKAPRVAKLLLSLAIAAPAGLATVLLPGEGARFLGTGGFFAAATLALTALEPVEDGRLNGFWAACGDASYGIYLWHVPLQAALFVGLTPYFQLGEVAKSPWFLVAYLVVVCTVARAMFLLYERPARTWIRQRFSTVPSSASPAVAAP